MQNEPKSRLPGEGQFPAKTREALDAAAQARRRALVKGLGRGGAVLAAVAPIQSFAVPKLNPEHACTLSGMMSGVASHSPTGGPGCQAWPPEHFYTPDIKAMGRMAQNWPAGVGGNDASVTLTFSGIFGGADTRPVLYILRLQDVVSGDDRKRVWITAYFNAWISDNNFPYTPAQVVSQFNGPSAEDFVQFYAGPDSPLVKRTV